MYFHANNIRIRARAYMRTFTHPFIPAKSPRFSLTTRLLAHTHTHTSTTPQKKHNSHNLRPVSPIQTSPHLSHNARARSHGRRRPPQSSSSSSASTSFCPLAYVNPLKSS